MNIRPVFVNPDVENLRAGWRIGLLLALVALSNAAVTVPLMSVIKTTVPGFPLQAVGTAFAYLMVTLATWVMLRFVDKRPFISVGLTFRSRWVKELGQGLFFGSAMMSMIFLIESAFGMVVIEYRVQSFGEVLPVLANSLALYIAVGYGEELLFRGYLFQSFVEGTNRLIATLSISLLFAVAHAGNPNASLFGLINVGLAGIWLSIAYFKTRTLWLPIGLHISWNFCQGFVYGYPVSGTTSDKEQIATAIVNGPDWLTGGAFGPEGGALATLMLILGTAMIYFLPWVGAAEGVLSVEEWREERRRQVEAQRQVTEQVNAPQ